MKTVKLKNTVSNKIELPSLASVINDMPKVKSDKPQMTAQQSEGMVRSKEIIENYEKQEKLQQTYTRLRQNLEACREAKPDNLDNEKNEKAIDHFEDMAQGIESKIEEYKQNAERQIQHIKDNLTKSLNVLQRKLNFANGRLQKAKERKNKVKKTKEEIRLEKQLQQLMIDFKKTNPDKDLDYYFPGYKTLIGPLPSPTSDKVEETLEEDEEDEEEEEEEETEEEMIARIQKRTDATPWQKLVLCNTKKLSTYELYHHALANGITPDIPEPPNPKKPQEDELTLWNKMTHWQRFVKQNPKKSLYALYHEALEMGITPDIPEPPNPKPATHANKTVSRESLAKIIPGYN